MTAAFSRLQLAAALLEYDNDETDPSAPYRSAHESAIFAHLRRHPARPQPTQRRSEYLSVALPSETGSVFDGRKSRVSSIGPLRNPFGVDDTLEDEGSHEIADMEVDLTSWGLDAFMAKDKDFKGKGKAKSLPSSHPLSAVQAYLPQTADVLGDVPRKPRATRSLSAGNYDFLSPAEEVRRRSISSPLDLSGLELHPSFQRPVAPSSQGLAYDDEEEPEPAIGSIPFPTTSIRSPSPMPTLDHDRQRRTYSTASIDSKMAMSTARLRTTSTGTMEPGEDNPFALAPPSRASRFDPKAAAHARTISNASLGSRMLLDNDGASVMTGRPPQENRYSTALELLRPKVLVMPSPLQSANAPPPPPPQGRDGFILAENPPLPPGARTAPRSSSSGAVPVPSNSFTPNPRLNLSLSQLTFRNNLTVGGQRDIAYNDVDDIPRAIEDGEQVRLSTTPTMELEMVLPIPPEDTGPTRRPAGKLYGKSLIDDLESRKALMKSKQRVFRGDDRPTMMARTPLKRGSTLIDPATLQDRPATMRMSSFEPASGLARRNSGHAAPLLNFDEDDKVPRVTVNKGAPKSSVFGVDTLWERELAKLREVEAQEAFERERQQALEETEALKGGKKKKKKKGKKGELQEAESTSQIHGVSPLADTSVLEETPAGSSVPSGPPILPTIRPVIRGPPPIVNDDASDSGESARGQATKAKSTKVEGWYAESSDEDNHEPRRTTGVGTRYPQKQPSLPHALNAGDDSEEDLPLAATINRAVQRTTRLTAPESDSDEEKPLAALIAKSSLPSINFDSPSPLSGADNDDDDNQPLGLRASRVMPSAAEGEDDDRPLAFHPEQQRRTQYQMMAQHQMMMQAQMHNSMFFSPSMSGFFPPAMVMPQMVPQAPIPIPSPPPVHDSAKYGRVDRWRHDVAIEGD